MTDQPNFQMRVGFWAFIALILFLYGWSWLKGLSLFHPPQRFTVQFHDVAGLNNNAPVNVNGVRIGTVDKLSLKKKGDVSVDLKINSEDVIIPKGSIFSIQTLGMVGAKYVEITLPDDHPGEPPPPALDQNMVVIGQDPVRVELVVNKVATSLSQINFGDVQKSMSKDMERVALAADSLQDAAHRIGGVADEAKGAATNANSFFARGTHSFDKIDQVATGSRTSLEHFTAFTDDWRTTSRRLNRILDNPALTTDLKETVEKARQTAEMVQGTMREFSKTLGDQPLRQDLLAALDKLNVSTENVYKSVKVVQQVSGDQGLRADVKQMVGQARDTMNRVNELISQPTFGADLKVTIDRVKKASEDVDLVARQMNQVLNQKHPLMKMIWGSPGKLKQEVQPVPVKNETTAAPKTNEQLAQPNGAQLADPDGSSATK